MGDTTTRGLALRVRTALCLLLVVTLPLTGGGGFAAADPTSLAAAPADDEDGEAEPLVPDGILPADLIEQMAELNQQIAELAQNAQPLEGERQALEQRASALRARNSAHNQKVIALRGRIDAHNGRPRIFQLPRQAAEKQAYDAEAAQLNAEKGQLDAEGAQGQAEEAALRAEQSQLNAKASAGKAAVQKLAAAMQQLRQRIAAAMQKRAKPRPPAARRASGGDPARQSSPRDSARDTGGDRPSRKDQDAALDRYAKERGVEVHRRPATANLTPEAVAKLTPNEAAKLRSSTTFDGLVRRPDGNYTALRVPPRNGKLTAAQKAFDAAIDRGGKATVTVNGKTITIDRVEQAPRNKPNRSCSRPNSFTGDTPVLMADGTHRPIAEVRVGDQVTATDPVTGRTQARPVTNLITGDGVKQLVAVTVDGHGVIQATDGHPFWVDGPGQWREAKDLKLGDRLREPDGHWVTVTATHHWTATQKVHNLTVDELHTYYVLAAGTPVLVHNDDDGLDLKGKSYTVWKSGPYRIDIEGSPSGVQMHFQEQINGVKSSDAPKYHYNPETGEFDGMPNSLKKELAKNHPTFKKGVAKGADILRRASGC